MDHTYDTGDIKLDITEEQVIVQTIEDEPTTVLLQQTLSEEMGTDDVESPDDTCKVDAVPGGLGGSNNFYIKLINLVRSYPNIYDKFDASFKVPLAREKSWIEIAQSLNTSGKSNFISFVLNFYIGIHLFIYFSVHRCEFINVFVKNHRYKITFIYLIRLLIFFFCLLYTWTVGSRIIYLY